LNFATVSGVEQRANPVRWPGRNAHQSSSLTERAQGELIFWLCTIAELCSGG
jgi:hypothetical protein